MSSLDKNLKDAPLIFNNNLIIIGFASPSVNPGASNYLTAYEENPTILNVQINKDNQVINFLPMNANPIAGVFTQARRYFWKSIDLSLLQNFFELDDTLEFPVIGERQGQEIEYNWVLNDNITGNFDDNGTETPTFFQGYVDEDLESGSKWILKNNKSEVLANNFDTLPVSYDGKGWLSVITDNNVSNIVIEHKGEIYISDETINYSTTSTHTNLMIGYSPTQLNSLNWLRVDDSSIVSDDLDIGCTDSYNLYLIKDEFPILCVCDPSLISQLETDLLNAQTICEDDEYIKTYELDLEDWYIKWRDLFGDLSNIEYEDLEEQLFNYVIAGFSIDRIDIEQFGLSTFGINTLADLFDFDSDAYNELRDILVDLRNAFNAQQTACQSIPTIQSDLAVAIAACEDFKGCVITALQQNQITKKYTFRSVDYPYITFYTRRGSIINFPIAKVVDDTIVDNREFYDSSDITVELTNYSPSTGATFNTNQDYTKPNIVTYLESEEYVNVKSTILSDKESKFFNQTIADSYLIYIDDRPIALNSRRHQTLGRKANYFELQLRIK